MELRFRKSGKVLPWHKDMATVSPFLGALVEKLGAAEGPSTEADEQGRALVDDSDFDPEVIDFLIAVLQEVEPNLHLKPSQLLQCLQCADRYLVPTEHLLGLQKALWLSFQGGSRWKCSIAKGKGKGHQGPSSPSQTREVFNFEGLQLHRAVTLPNGLSIKAADFRDLDLANLTVKEKVFLEESLFTSCLLGVRGSDLEAARCSFSKSKMPATSNVHLDGVKVKECEWVKEVGHLEMINSSLHKVTLPIMDTLTLVDSSLVLCDAPVIGEIEFHGSSSLLTCRFRQTKNEPFACDEDAGPVEAEGCVFCGMTFVLGDEPMSFVSCTFHRCTFQVFGKCDCVNFSKCFFMASFIRKGRIVGDEMSLSTQAYPTIREELGRCFSDDCQVSPEELAFTAELPESHRDWIAAPLGEVSPRRITPK